MAWFKKRKIAVGLTETMGVSFMHERILGCKYESTVTLVKMAVEV